jgi:hypothetical protein
MAWLTEADMLQTKLELRAGTMVFEMRGGLI